MPPYIGIEREPSGKEVRREFSDSEPGFHRVLDEPKVYLDVTPEGKGSLLFPPDGLKVVGERERSRVEQLVPKVPLERLERRKVVLYNSSGEEQVRIGWEPSKEERVRKRVRKEISKEMGRRYDPIYCRISDWWSVRKPLVVESLEDKGNLRRITVLGAMGFIGYMGSGFLHLGEVVFVFIPRGLNDGITGYWSKERKRLTNQYLSEPEEGQ